MSTYESIAYVSEGGAAEALEALKNGGEAAVVEYLRQGYEPGEGTLVSDRQKPWKAEDFIYEDGDWVLYYNTEVPYFGLVARLPDLK